MQKISIHHLGYNRETGNLSEEASTLSTVVDINQMLSGAHFEIVGARETRRYGLEKAVREESRYEVGDILYWNFRPVDRLGRFIPGISLLVFND